MKKWVTHNRSPEEDTLDVLYLHDTLPVALERERRLAKLKRPKLVDYEEMIGIKVTPTEKETNKEQQDEGKRRKDKLMVREHCFSKATKKWGEWSKCDKGKKTLKQPLNRRC